MDDSNILNFISLNCRGIKGNFEYINNMIHDHCDIVFVCEHWLKPCDISTVQMSYQSNNMWTNIKSGMQMNDTYIGRPYGGVGFIARKMANNTVRDAR